MTSTTPYGRHQGAGEPDRRTLMARHGAPRRSVPRRPGAGAARFVDAGTSLPNRVALMSEMEFAVAQGQGWVGMLVARADQPPVTTGGSQELVEHEAVLALAERLRVVLRPSDLVGRLGETVVGAALWGLDDPAPAHVVEQRVRAAFDRPVVLGGGDALRVQVGVAVVRPPEPVSTALVEAWSAMQRSARLPLGAVSPR